MHGSRVLTMALVAAAALAGAAQGAAVDAAVAERVAVAQMEKVFPGEAWVKADCVRVEDGEGGAAAWGFVFALEGSPYAAEGAVRAALAAGECGDDGESELYASTATLVTGANDTDSLVFRQFRGLAGWYAELVANEAKGGSGAAVRLGPGDIRYAAAAPAGARGAGKLGALKKAAAQRKAARAAAAESLPDELKAAAAEADAEAAAVAKARWGEAAAEARQAQRKAALRAAE